MNHTFLIISIKKIEINLSNPNVIPLESQQHGGSGIGSRSLRLRLVLGTSDTGTLKAI